jgi:hypothetical protein
MTDRAALTVTTHSPADPTQWNPNEPKGNDIAIYSIGLGSVLNNANAENLLRYMAAVGDDGDRVTDPCASTPINQNCGQYYFAPDSNQLVPIFENIASRIYTRITE